MSSGRAVPWYRSGSPCGTRPICSGSVNVQTGWTPRFWWAGFEQTWGWLWWWSRSVGWRPCSRRPAFPLSACAGSGSDSLPTARRSHPRPLPCMCDLCFVAVQAFCMYYCTWAIYLASLGPFDFACSSSLNKMLYFLNERRQHVEMKCTR